MYVNGHADCVEADYLSGRSRAPAVAKPHRRQPPKACPLALAQRGQRVLIGANTAAVLTDPTGLDLGEHERAPVEGDQVDLTVARANVAPQDAKADPPQVRRRQLLAESTQRSPRVTGRSGEVLRRGGPVGGQGAITLQIAWEVALTCARRSDTETDLRSGGPSPQAARFVSRLVRFFSQTADFSGLQTHASSATHV